MAVNWKRLADQHPAYTESDFQKAASRLLTDQILYQSVLKQRNDYDLISNFEKDFTEALNLFGYELDHNSRERYIAAVPMHPDVSKVPLMHTLLALVLRKLYDHHMQRGILRAGIAGVSLPELETAFKESTGRSLEMKPQTKFLDLMDSMKRWGVARTEKDHNLGESTVFVEILPGIQSLITQRSLAILKDHAEELYEPDSDENDSLGE